MATREPICFYLKWVDSAHLFGGGWSELTELLDFDDETYCETVGWVVRENKHSLFVASSLAPQQIGSVMQIPKVAIKIRQKLAL